MAEKSNIIDIVNGISQAAANAYDGALDDKGEPLKVGLKREEGNPILDKRVVDGFNVSIAGNILNIKYQGEIMLKDVYKGAASALTVQFDEEKPETGENLRKENTQWLE